MDRNRFFPLFIFLFNFTIFNTTFGGPHPLASFPLVVASHEELLEDTSQNTINYISVENLQTTHKRTYTMDQFIGTNAFIDVPQDKMKAVGFIREYHPWGFTEELNDKFEYNRWNGFWDFDTYYKNLKAANIDVCPAIWGSPAWLQANGLYKPVVGSESPLVPNSYREMAELMFQYAARYGSVTIDNSLLLVNTGQIKKSGLGYIKYYEDWNEQDRTWEGPDKRFTPQEYAAMVSANVDGHCGEMGANLGIKAADSSAHFVMGGLAGLGTGYVSQMLTWFTQNRPDKKWPVDVINMHHYCEKNELIGNSPEDNGLKQKIAVVAQWRDDNVPENEFWLTEFGYDMNNTSVNRVPVFAGFTQEQVQAQWLLRTYLVLSSTGVDRVAQFMLRDQEPENTEARFRDCGLTGSQKNGYIPKLSWYGIYTMKNVLKGLYFDQVITENADVWAYRYTHPDSVNQVVALWCPTSIGKTINYELTVPQGLNSAEIIIPNKSIGGERQVLEVSAGKVMVNVSEMPVFIEFSLITGNKARKLTKNADLLIFPNPGIDEILIRWPEEFNIVENINVNILDLSGRNCIQDEFYPGHTEGIMNLEKLKPGTYILSASQQEKCFRQRFVKSN